MRFVIKHEIKGRIHIHVLQNRMSYEQADTLEYYLNQQGCVVSVRVRERIQDAVVCYTGDRNAMIDVLRRFHYDAVKVPDTCLQKSSRELNETYFEQLVDKIVLHYGCKFLIPQPIRMVITWTKALKYIWLGLKCLFSRKIEVPVLDATAILVSLLRNDCNTAGSVMFLLGIGEILEEWTHKKSVDDLARSMALNVGNVWLKRDGQEILVPVSEVQSGDRVVVHMGNVIPFDGMVVDGDAMVNQASLTGESMPVHKTVEGYVYAGTVIEEGEITLLVKEITGSSKYESIVTMIEESEKLKSSVEGKAEHLADQLVPYTLLGSGLTYLFTRNVTKAVAVLMVDFSCALKLAMPITVLSAIREAGNYSITVKGGKFLEAISEADTVVFDKTGTLTKAQPVVIDVISFNGETPDELLRIAACMEEHFPHSMAKAVVEAAAKKGLVHEEVHSKVEYIVAHGIATTIEDKRAIIGSYHFIFEDEGCAVPEGMEETFRSLPTEYSHLYMAIEGKLAAVICIEDPLRQEAPEVIRKLKAAGIRKIVMMTGDSERTAHAIAAKVGVDEYYSEVLPEDKAHYVEQEKSEGRKVIMIGDGINDSPALSAADVGIAISDGAEIAREIADITVGADSLHELIILKEISNALMKRIHKNYRMIVGINTSLILLGVFGVLPPTVSALLHNTSTIAISLSSMKNLLEDHEVQVSD